MLLLNVIALAYYRNTTAVFVFLGACICAATAKVLKRIVRQERPRHSSSSSRHRQRSFGMPSAHSASVAYFATLLSALARDAGSSGSVSGVYVLAATVILGAAGLAAAMYRVHGGHHTLPQVAAGGCLGWAVASAWWASRGLVIPQMDIVAGRVLGGWIGNA
ncbi:hypothetical protein LPJ61_001539 [Coemansia biformis]|uniref:Phosphatidic acid phosphatase type 2/haloperoxidase domain-containing protein n=1 Tax=Coemansia biformis TaxID=1286918 RepID=A0A9W7YFS7_9FUNG|nr:hypothetical protein LPJ61_001539 [Coemansia biformis]